MDRRNFLMFGGGAALAGGAGWLALSRNTPRSAQQASSLEASTVNAIGNRAPVDRFDLRIAPMRLEIAPNRMIETIGYDGGSPGQVLRMRSGVPTAVDVRNDTDRPELVHWHGQHLPAAVDGAHEQGTPPVPARGQRRYIFLPGPSGTRWYHSHGMSEGGRLGGLYTGQQGIVLVQPRGDPGAYDREVLLITHDWDKLLEKTDGENGAGKPAFSINGRSLGHGEPVRVRPGERILFRIVNGNAEDEVRLSLPGHRFHIVALDGNPVPRPQPVDFLRLGSGERIDAIVEMTSPGIWVLGDVRDDRRNRGMGVVVEYSGQSGAPNWRSPATKRWNYLAFGEAGAVPTPDATIELIFDKGPAESRSRGNEGGQAASGGDAWRINGQPFWKQQPKKLNLGWRYRLVFRDRSGKLHPLHLHRHSFELVAIDGQQTSGIIKDTVCIEPNGSAEVDFVADQKGLSLFHCHIQNHMDNGFMSLFDTI